MCLQLFDDDIFCLNTQVLLSRSLIIFLDFYYDEIIKILTE